MKARVRRLRNSEAFRSLVRERALARALGIGEEVRVRRFWATKRGGKLVHYWRRLDPQGMQDGLVAACLAFPYRARNSVAVFSGDVGPEIDPLDVPIGDVCRLCRKAIVTGREPLS